MLASLQNTATHCNTLQHTATHCNTPQRITMTNHTQSSRLLSCVFLKINVYASYHTHHVTQQCAMLCTFAGWILRRARHHRATHCCGCARVTLHIIAHATGWRRPMECLKLHVIFRKRATNYRALLRKMSYKNKASCESMPPCNTASHVQSEVVGYAWRHTSWHRKNRLVTHILRW